MKKYLLVLASLALLCSCEETISEEEREFSEKYTTDWSFGPLPAYTSEHNIWRPADGANTMTWKLLDVDKVEWVQGPEVKHEGSSYEFTMPVRTGNKEGTAMLTIKPDVDIVTDANKRYDCMATVMCAEQIWINWKFYEIPDQDGQPMGWVFGRQAPGLYPDKSVIIARGGAEITPIYNKPLLLQLNFGNVSPGTIIRIKDITIKEHRYWGEGEL